MMAKPKTKRRAGKKAPSSGTAPQVSALQSEQPPAAPDTGPEPVVESPKTPAASRRSSVRSQKKAPIGWTLELSTGLKAAMAYQALALEIDQEAGHLAAGLVALMEGQFELAGLNLWHAGLAEAPVPTVEEGFG